MKEVKRPRKQLILYYAAAFAVLLVFNIFAMPRLTNNSVAEVDYGTFMTMIAEGNVGKAEIGTDYIVFTDKKQENVYKTVVLDDPDLIDRLYSADAQFSGELTEQPSPFLSFLLSWIFPVLFFVILGNIFSGIFMNKAGGSNSIMFNMGKSKAKIYVKSSGGIRFSDVAGVDEAKESLKEVVDYLDNPEKYTKIGASMPKGVLLVGPPGTGKTMIAKAVAGEANVPFFSMSGSEFVEMFVGMGASKVRDLFRQAKEKAPCIIFIDEIDAIGQRRDGRPGGNDEREQTLNQLLTEMDGFEGNTGVIMLAATNRYETLDPALTRPGRFDRRIPVELPDLKGREAILKVHSEKIKTDGNINYLTIARMASGASGAELANIINEAALRAVRAGRQTVSQADMEACIEVVIAGYEKKNSLLTDKEKLTVAYHEMGHAIVAAKQKGTSPIQKITIVPRTSGALGYTLQTEEDNKYLLSKSEIESRIAILTAGRAAEQIGVGTATTGAANDIFEATKLARAAIMRFGMSDHFGMMALEVHTNVSLGGDSVLNCSAETLAKADALVAEFIKKQYDKAVEILTENRKKLDELALYLYHNETVGGKEFLEILNTDDISEEK